jgi:pyrroloquinoline quinone biosynthesis protein E
MSKRIKVRAEQDFILLWNIDSARTSLVSGAEMKVLHEWADGGSETGFIRRLKELDIVHDDCKSEIAAAIAESKPRKSPLRSFYAPESLHIELTSRCDLNCPQCYKQLSHSDLPLEKLSNIIRQAAVMKVFQIAYGGGEPLMYPHIFEAVEETVKHGISTSVTTSGYGFDRHILDEFVHAGLNHIQISLNGSDESVNSKSRDGFDCAVSALEVISKSKMSFGINWVARNDNIHDFPNLIELARKMNVGNVNILRYKPSRNEEYSRAALTREQNDFLVDVIKRTKGVCLKVDSAYSSLLCRLNRQNSFLGGCGAGRRFVAIDSQGRFKPCSHVEFSSDVDSIAEYWKNDETLMKFRQIEVQIANPCKNCEYLASCCGCRAVVIGCSGEFYGADECGLF